MRDDKLRIADMLEALERIRSFASVGRAAFFQDVKTHEAVAYEILKLGAAANRLSRSFRAANPRVPWQLLIDLRNEVVHDYFRIDSEALWEFISSELDGLERALRAV